MLIERLSQGIIDTQAKSPTDVEMGSGFPVNEAAALAQLVVDSVTNESALINSLMALLMPESQSRGCSGGCRLAKTFPYVADFGQ